MTDTASATVRVSIDGRQVEAVPGEMIIAAAERAGTFIPRFCYHPRMKPVGMCRMCLVEFKGRRGSSLQPACFVAVEDGQEVVTDSPQVKKAQDGVLEFLLVNHPLDCPVCDKGGECPLQDQTLAYGPGESRFIEEKRHFEKPIPISDLVDLDRERCIQCGRCTRFALEIAGEPLIDFLDRGDHLEVNTFPDEPFASYFSGNTVQICPVGALTATPYRFRARPWDLEQVESTCTTCSFGCRVVVQSSSNRLTRYLGVDSDPVNQSWMCDKGRFDFEAVNSDERLTEPMVRKGSDLAPVSWAKALEAAANGVQEATSARGSGTVGVIGGARLANEDAYAWAKLAKSVIGTDSVDAQLGDGIPAEVVLGLPRATIDQACNARAVVVLAPDIREELPVLFLRLRQAALERGPELIEVAPTATCLAPFATRLRYRPGEVADLVRALTGSADPDREAGGVQAGSIASARQAIGRGRGGDVVVVLGRPSLAESGAAIVEAAAVLRSALPDVRFLPALRRANVHGAMDMGMAPGVLPGRVSLEAGRAWFAQAWGDLPSARGLDSAGMLAAAAEGRISVLVLVGCDPLSDFPDRHLARAAIERVNLLVAVDSFMNASVSQADVVLPAAMYSERSGTTTNVEGRVTRLGKMLVAPGVARPDWMIAAELAAGLGCDLGLESLEDIWKEIERVAPSHRGLSADVLDASWARDGVVVPIKATPVAVRTEEGPDGGVARIDPMATPGIDAVNRQGLASLAGASTPDSRRTHGTATSARRPPLLDFAGSMTVPAQAGPTAHPVVPSDAGAGGAMRLVSARRLYDAGTMLGASPSLAPLAEGALIRVNPLELVRLGASPGNRVRVRSLAGELVLETVADDRVPQGVVAVPFNAAGGAAAELIDAAADFTEVSLEAADAR